MAEDSEADIHQRFVVIEFDLVSLRSEVSSIGSPSNLAVSLRTQTQITVWSQTLHLHLSQPDT